MSDCSISRICLSPKGSFLILVNAKSELFLQNICSVDGQLSDLSSPNKGLPEPKFVGTASSPVTCLQWTEDEKQLFFGERNGTVSVVGITHFLKGNLLHATLHPILLLDSEIVQIDCFDLLLVVSTRTACILCNTDREEFKQIGNRPRDGSFGACFINKSIDEYLRGQVICARPGARFWIVDYGGTVKQTIQFKEALAMEPIRPHIPQTTAQEAVESEEKRDELNNVTQKTETETSPLVSSSNKKYSTTHNLSFSQLIELRVNGEHFLVTYTTNGIFVFDPHHSRMILWTDYFKDITNVFVVESVIYCICSSDEEGIKVGRFQVRHRMHIFETLLLANEYENIKRFIADNRNYLKSKSIEIDESLRPKMELTKEFLIREQEYECLEIISNIGYLSSDIKSPGRHGNVQVLSVGRDSSGTGAGEKTMATTTRTLIASALRNTFHLFSQATAGRGQPLIRANSSDLSLKNNYPPQRLDLFREITTNFTSSATSTGGVVESEAIVDKKRFFTNKKFKKLSELLKSNEGHEDDAMKETKMLKNLFLIYKSSRMSNVNMVERYAPLLDTFSLNEVLDLMKKLETLMLENDCSTAEAKQNSSMLLFDYISPAVVADGIDNETLEQLIERYILVNGSKGRRETKCCEVCYYPLEVVDECLYYDFGRTLFEFLYARGDAENYQKLLKNIPQLLHVFVKYYRDDASAERHSYLQLVFILRKFSVANQLSGDDWSQLLDMMHELKTKSILRCFKCSKWNEMARMKTDRPFEEIPEEYSWNFMLNQAARFMSGPALLRELVKHSNAIKRGEISKQFFHKCMQTA